MPPTRHPPLRVVRRVDRTVEAPHVATIRLMRLAADTRFIVAAWLATRGLIVALIFLVSRGDVSHMQDVGYYHEVARHLLDTRTMPATEMWQYPPGATVVLLIPQLAGDAGYGIAFVAFMVACDATITWLLARAARSNGSLLGLWGWLLLMPAMREYPLLRFDMVPTLCAVAALLFAVRRPALFGALAGLGALIKAWPIVVLGAEWRLRRLAIAAIVAGAVLFGGIAVAEQVFGPQDRALDNQAGRGLQNEAVAASPWHFVGSVNGDGAPLHYGSGATEINDRRAERVADALRWATAAVGVLLAAWWALRALLLRRDPDRRSWLASNAAGADLVTVGVLLAIVTSRVLSPQFMVWLLAVAAISMTFPNTRLRRPFVLIALATICTAGVLRYPEVLVARNLLLAIASIDALVLLWTGLRARDDVDRQVVDLLDAQSATPRDADHVVDAPTLA